MARRSKKESVWLKNLLWYAAFVPGLFFTPKGASLGYYGAWIPDIAGGALKSAAASQGMWFEGPGVLNQSLRPLVFRFATGSGYSALFHRILAVVFIGCLCLTFGLLLGSARIENPYVITRKGWMTSQASGRVTERGASSSSRRENDDKQRMP